MARRLVLSFGLLVVCSWVPVASADDPASSAPEPPAAAVDCPPHTRPVTEPIQLRLGRLRHADAGLYAPADELLSRLPVPPGRRLACAVGSAGRLKDGPAVELTAEGVPVAEGAYRAGRREGIWRHWSLEGRLLSEVRYQAGRLHGAFTSWHASGHVWEHGLYRNGVRRGAWLENDERGRVRSIVAHDDENHAPPAAREPGR